MNASPYRGIAPRSTAAQRARRALVARIGRDAVDTIDRERVDHYRELIRVSRLTK
ncbi:MAG: hypothetical protein ACO3S3_12420 [Pseudohongiellaceae bacterium]